MSNLVIFGLTDAAELAHYYFMNDTDHKVVAFTVDSTHLPANKLFCGLPVVPFEEICYAYPPSKNKIFVALGYSNLNANRRYKYAAVKEKGYNLVSYISSKATILNEGRIGDNCFILEDNTIQPFVSIGNNVTLWSGNHIGHHSIIDDHCFLASQIVVSGRVHVGESCFIGVNATLRDNITIGRESIIGAGTLILDNVEPKSVYIGKRSEKKDISSDQMKKI